MMDALAALGRGCLSLSLFLCLTIRLDLGPAVADERRLQIGDGAETRTYSLGDLERALGLSQLRVDPDPQFGAARVYVGFPFEALLAHVGLGDAAGLLLISADGYSVPVDLAGIRNRPVSGLLAVRDAEFAPDSPQHWRPYRHGAEWIDFDPFYLVWSAQPGASTDASDTEALPWPFQLTEIRRLDRDAYFAPARPAADASPAVWQGFGVFTAQCGKCHRLRGVGGGVGPVLDREGALPSLLPDAELARFIAHDPEQFPNSKMPAFRNRLTPAEIGAVAAYLRAMNGRD